MKTFCETVEFVVEHCYRCNVPFALSRSFYNSRQRDQATFWCPAGHGQVYKVGTEQRLRNELEEKQAQLDAERGKTILLKNERDDIAKAHKRMRTRVMNGVCPCCNRTFQNLMQHMKTEHSDFGDLDLRTLRTAYGLTQGAVAKEAGVNVSHISLAERHKPIAPYAKKRIDWWLEENTKVKS